MKRNSDTSHLVSITVWLGADLKADLHECAKKLELSQNDIARHAIKGACQFIKAMGFCHGPPFKVTVNDPVEPDHKSPGSQNIAALATTSAALLSGLHFLAA